MSVEFTSRIPELMIALEGATREGVRDVAQAIADEARANAPVRTGALRDSIEMTVVSDEAAQVSVGVDYGVYQEFGTSKMSAQPFLTPAVESVRARAGEIIARRVQAELK
jgi:HK97 gp10 family phage protein